jgi:hypothetical protein
MVFGVLHQFLQTPFGAVPEILSPGLTREIHNRRYNFQYLPEYLQRHVHERQAAVFIHDRNVNRFRFEQDQRSADHVPDSQPDR